MGEEVVIETVPLIVEEVVHVVCGLEMLICSDAAVEERRRSEEAIVEAIFEIGRGLTLYEQVMREVGR